MFNASLPRSKPSLSCNNSSVSRRDASLSYRNPETIWLETKEIYPKTNETSLDAVIRVALTENTHKY